MMDEMDRLEMDAELRLSEDPTVTPEAEDLEDAEFLYNARKKHFDVYNSDLSDTSEGEEEESGELSDSGAEEGEDADEDDEDGHDAALSELLITRFDEKFPEDAATRDAAILLQGADDQVHRVQMENIRWDYAKATYNVSTMHDLRRALYVYRRVYGVNLLREDAELSDVAGKLGKLGTLVESDVSDFSGSDLSDSDLSINADRPIIEEGPSDEEEEVFDPKLAFAIAGASDEGEDHVADAADSSDEELLSELQELYRNEDSDGEETDIEDSAVEDLERAIGQELIRRGALTSGPDGVRELLESLELPPEFDEQVKDMFGQVTTTTNFGAPLHRRGYRRDLRGARASAAGTSAGAEGAGMVADSAAAATAAATASKGTTAGECCDDSPSCAYYLYVRPSSDQPSLLQPPAADKATPKAAVAGFFDQGELPPSDKAGRA